MKVLQLLFLFLFLYSLLPALEVVKYPVIFRIAIEKLIGFG